MTHAEDAEKKMRDDRLSLLYSPRPPRLRVSHSERFAGSFLCSEAAAGGKRVKKLTRAV
jgi:hypothetical protein